MVYFIEAVGAGLVKIGFTDGDPNDRLRQLQTGSAHPLRLRAVMEGDMAAEKSHHQRFAHLRESGEWFKFTTELEVYVGLAMWIQPRLTTIELRINEIQKLLTEIGVPNGALEANIEGAWQQIEYLLDDVRVLKTGAATPTFGGV